MRASSMDVEPVSRAALRRWRHDRVRSRYPIRRQQIPRKVRTWLRAHRGSIRQVCELIHVEQPTMGRWLWMGSRPEGWRVRQIKAAIEMLESEGAANLD